MAAKIIFGLIFSAVGIFLLIRGMSSYEDNVPQLVAGGISIVVGILIISIGS